MWSLSLFFIILVGGCTLWVSVGHRRFEEAMPLSCCCIVLLLFIGGVFGSLLSGVYLVCGLYILSIILSLVYIILKKELKRFFSNFFSPVFFVFAVIYLSLFVFNRGRLSTEWDEYSHWADVVNAMLSIDDFATNPASLSMYKAYPPAMPLFQYFPQRLGMLLSPAGCDFAEDQLFFCYQLFSLSFFLPFLKKLSFKRPFVLLSMVAAVYLAPMYIYKYAFAILLIDPFIGVVTGAGMALIFTREKKDWAYCANIFMCLAVLVLAKDSGLLLAFALWLGFALDWMLNEKPQISGKSVLRRSLPILLGLVAFILPKILWSINVRINHAMVNQDLVRLFNVSTMSDLVLGRLPNTDYRYAVIRSFVVALFTETVKLGDTGISVSYMVLWVCLLSLLYFMCRLFYRFEPQFSRTRRMLFWLMFGMEAVYIAGVCIGYLFAFSEFEARNLASFERYIGVVFMAQTVMLALLAVDYIQRMDGRQQKTAAVIMLCITMFMTPWNNAIRFFSRMNVSEAAAFRAPYNEFAQYVEDVISTNGEGKLYFICEESNGFEYWVTRFNLRPYELQYLLPSNIVASEDELDAYSAVVLPEDLKATLMDDFDYVIIYKTSDNFEKAYASLFEEPEDISDRSIFRLDRSTGLLQICG